MVQSFWKFGWYCVLYPHEKMEPTISVKIKPRFYAVDRTAPQSLRGQESETQRVSGCILVGFAEKFGANDQPQNPITPG